MRREKPVAVKALLILALTPEFRPHEVMDCETGSFASGWVCCRRV